MYSSAHTGSSERAERIVKLGSGIGSKARMIGGQYRGQLGTIVAERDASDYNGPGRPRWQHVYDVQMSDGVVLTLLPDRFGVVS